MNVKPGEKRATHLLYPSRNIIAVCFCLFGVGISSFAQSDFDSMKSEKNDDLPKAEYVFPSTGAKVFFGSKAGEYLDLDTEVGSATAFAIGAVCTAIEDEILVYEYEKESVIHGIPVWFYDLSLEKHSATVSYWLFPFGEILRSVYWQDNGLAFLAYTEEYIADHRMCFTSNALQYVEFIPPEDLTEMKNNSIKVGIALNPGNREWSITRETVRTRIRDTMRLVE